MSGKATYSKVLFLDIETEGSVDLGAEGTGRYFADPFTQITCAAFAIGETGPVKVVDWNTEQDQLRAAMKECDILVAHNATFDFMGLGIDPDTCEHQLCCTMAMCALANFPQSLRDAANAFNREFRKLSKPELLNTGGQSGLFDYRNATQEQKDEFFEYNRKDVEAMRELFYTLVDYTPPHEMDAIDAHLRVNMRGIPFVREELEQAFKEEDERQKEVWSAFKKKTGLDVRQPDKLRKYLMRKYGKVDEGDARLDLEGPGPKGVVKGIEIKSMNALELSKLLDVVDEEDRELLKMRIDFGKSDAAKLDRIRTMVDGKVSYGTHNCTLRNVFVFSQAITGRWASRGAQMHNNKRGGVIKKLVKAPEGWQIYVSDFSQIELRIAMWLAGGVEEIQQIHKGNYYEEVAGQVYGKPASEVSSQERFMGKQLALGCNYGMGAERFVFTCGQYGVKVELDEAQKLVTLYREKIAPIIPGAWHSLQSAAIRTMKTGQETVPKGVRGVKFHYIGGPFELLKVRIPTGRHIHYWNARLTRGENGEGIEYIDPSKKSGKPSIETGAHWMENISQAVSRDLMARSLVRFNNARDTGVLPFLHVHDEIAVLFCWEGGGSNEEVLNSIMLDKKFTEGEGVNHLLLAVESHIVDRWGDAK